MRLIGVGVGPGDPELLTVRAVSVLRSADRVAVPVLSPDEEGRAERVVRAVTDRPLVRLAFALSDRGGVTAARRAAWDAAAATVASWEGTVAFATLGDPAIYSTFTYLAQGVALLRPDVQVETVPGITAMQDLAARSGTVLCEGDESLVLLPLTAGLPAFETALTGFDTVVGYKGGRQVGRVREVLARHGRLGQAVFGSGLGLAEERIGPVPEDEAPYLSTVLVPPHRGGRGGRLS